ncbi:MAG: hypothetical protein IT422_12830 [Pirellulaceae bacterium]|jgi:tetratricopeptide (TPR) repeat protein|nr:hypothetical protein [Pirellulaceae bacterium]
MRYPLKSFHSFVLGALFALGLAPVASLRAERPQGEATVDTPDTVEAAAPATDVSGLLKQLGDAQYSQRRQAFLQLWRVGQPALPAIASARNSPDRSVAAAAAVLHMLVDLRIAPQHLEESSRLFDMMSRPTPAAIVELCGMGYWSVAERMLLDNTELSQKFHDPYGRFQLSRLVDKALEQNDATLAWPIVRQLTSPPQAAWIAHKTGLELGRDDPYSRAQQLFFAGEVDAALEIDLPTVVHVPMLTRTGRWQQLLDEQVVTLLAGRGASPSQQAATAVLHEAAGDYDTASEIWIQLLQAEPTSASHESPPSESSDANDASGDQELDRTADSPADETDSNDTAHNVAPEHNQEEKEAAQVRRAVELLGEADRDGQLGQTNKYQLMAALLFSGRVEAIEQMLLEQDSTEAFNFFLAGNQHARAFEALGLAADLSNFDAWLLKLRDQIGQELSQRNPDNRNFDQCTRLCSILSGLGYRQQAQQLLDELVVRARLEPRRQADLWSRSLLLWLGRSEARQLALVAAKAQFPQMSGECQSVVLKGLFPEFGETAYALWSTAPGETDERKWQDLENLYVFDRAWFGSDYRTQLSGWLQRAMDALAKGGLTPEHLNALAEIALGFGESDMAVEMLQNDLSPGLGQSTSPNLQWATAARIMSQRGKSEASLSLFRDVRQSGSNPQQTYVDEVQALLLSGHFALARELEQSRWLRPLATTRFYQGYNYLQAAQELSESHQWERAAEYAEAAFLLADLGSMDVYWGASEYAEILEKLKDPVRRADVLRAAWIESLQPFASSMQYMFSNGYSSSLRFSAQKEKLARAIVCIVQDDMPGFQHQVAVARKLQSQDIEVVCQCYPLLQKAGKTAIAEELFASYEADMQQQLAQWPNDATALNNLAWMYSQCDVKLDEALELSHRAIKLAPNSAVFLDTLAEVQFRSGAIEEALDTMRQCVRLDPRELHYRENLVRFHAAK